MLSEKDLLTSGFWNPRVKYLWYWWLHLVHTPFTLLLNCGCILGEWKGQLLPVGQGAINNTASRQGPRHPRPAPQYPSKGSSADSEVGPGSSKSPDPQASSWWRSRPQVKSGSKSTSQNQSKWLRGRSAVTRHAQSQARVQINAVQSDSWTRDQYPNSIVHTRTEGARQSLNGLLCPQARVWMGAPAEAGQDH